MTQPTDDFDELGTAGGADELFEVRAHQDHLLIVKLWDEVSPVVTERCPTGYVTRNGKEWPNNALRASVVDLDMDADDGSRGRVYPAAMIFAGLLIKELKHKVGRTLLLVWRQQDPSDKSSPYSVWDMKGDAAAVEVGRKWLGEHPEFKTIPAPPPWTNTPREDSRDNGHRRDDRDSGYGRRGDYDDRRPAERPRDGQPRYDRNYDPRYDDRGRQERSAPPRRGPYADDPWRQPSYDERRRGDRDGSFLSRSADSSRGGYQDEEPPF